MVITEDGHQVLTGHEEPVTSWARSPFVPGRLCFLGWIGWTLEAKEGSAAFTRFVIDSRNFATGSDNPACCFARWVLHFVNEKAR
jgi:hypothetical protein